MGITGVLHGEDLTARRLFVERPAVEPPVKIVKRPRIGVDYAGPWARRLLRFYVKGSPFVSRP
jgi:DNA-3-methyladenine glycosylase